MPSVPTAVVRGDLAKRRVAALRRDVEGSLGRQEDAARRDERDARVGERLSGTGERDGIERAVAVRRHEDPVLQRQVREARHGGSMPIYDRGMQSLAAAALSGLLAQLMSSHGGPPVPVAPAATPAPVSPVTSGGGLTWAVPKSWTPGPSSVMRLATYYLPASGGDADRPELAVFWFGPAQGGTIDQNVARWFSQFEAGSGDPKATRSLTRVGKVPVTLVTAAGTYSAGTGMNAPQAPKKGSLLRGAIAEGPNGAVFFKLTGPRRSVVAAGKDFDALVASLKP